MSKKNILIPAAILSVAALAVPTVAAAKPSIGVDSAPSCDGFSFTATQPGEAFESGQYTVTAQAYDSETVTPVGAEQVFTGAVEWGKTINVTIPEADDYLLWTYRVDSSADGEGLTTYGERQLDCRSTEQPDPEPEEPGDDVPLIPLEPATPVEPEVEEPEATEPETPEVEAPTPSKVVTKKTTTSGEPVEAAAVPVVTQPRTAG